LTERHLFQPFDIEVKEILLRAQNGEFACYFTANAATDIFYLYSKARDTKSARQALDFLLATYKAVSVTHEDGINAMSSPIENFEDALASVCAKKIAADYIINRDDTYLQSNSPIKVMEPKDFLRFIKTTTQTVIPS